MNESVSSHVFLTGATGYVGAAVAQCLRDAGHRVSALCRSAASAARVEAAGLAPVFGDLRSPASWAEAAADHDAIIHAAFEYADDGSEAADVDRGAVAAALAAARRGRCRQLVYTSNAFLLADLPGSRDLVDEAVDPARAVRPGRWRLDVEREVLTAGTDALRTAVVRVGAVYGGAGGSLPELFEHARRTRTLAYLGAGENRWSMIHHADLAALYTTIVGAGAAGIYHGVDGAPLTTRAIVERIAAAVGSDVITSGCPGVRARDELPYYASVLAADLAMASPRARALGWSPHIASFAAGIGATADALGALHR